ncbi:MAG: aminoacyl-tRNA hydrolase [Clostridia bacterium]|nr:aminoacyl-tRNA hydrolase [Clostridia bacterium]
MSNIFDLFKKIERRESTAPVSAILVGLGNPGLEYERTRHNVGFVSIDYIAEKLGARIDRLKFHALVGEATVGESRVLLMKPTTYMNNSGVAVQEAAAFYKISPERVIVLHDEISFEPGKIRLRRKGSAGGHNGLKSIIAHLGSEDFPRIKIGVGQKPTPEYDLADWVLGKLPEADRESINKRLPDIEESVKLILAGRMDDAMSRFSK